MTKILVSKMTESTSNTLHGYIKYIGPPPLFLKPGSAPAPIHKGNQRKNNTPICSNWEYTCSQDFQFQASSPFVVDSGAR